MNFNRMNRRHILRGIGAALTLPLLPSLLPRNARAETAPKSFIGVATYNGMYRLCGPDSQLMPRAEESGGSLVGLQKLPVPGRFTLHHESLATLAAANGGKVSDIIDQSFTPYLGKMMMLQGLDYVGLGAFHHEAHFGAWSQVSGAQGSGNPHMASLDVVIAEHYAKKGLPGDLVAYSACYEDNAYGPSFRADGSPTSSRFHDPATLWEKYFGNATIPTGDKALLVDKVLADYKSLKNNPRLGREDRQRVEAHVAHLAVTEARVKKVSQICQQLQPAKNLSDRALVFRTMNDVIVGLIACGMCHSFMGWGHSLVSDDPGQWHTWSHEGFYNDENLISNATAYGKMIDQNRSVMKDMCLDLVKKLDDVGHLDDTLIVVLQEHSRRGHEAWNVPAITFGSAGGVFNTNQYVDFRNIAERDDIAGYTRFGYPMNQLYANVLTAFGMAPSEFEALNKTRSDGYSPFKSGSGYGIPTLHPDVATGFDGTQAPMATHYSRFSGHDLSAPLPLIRS